MNGIEELGNYLRSDDPALIEAIEKSYWSNQWFTPDFSRRAIHSIANEYLNPDKYQHWTNTYGPSNSISKKVAIVMAGNIPLVGFHDLLSVLASGHQAIVKLSDKDAVLPKFIIDKWKTIDETLSERITYTDRLEGFDAVIATGSNNTSRYFEYYFSKYPHILRRNKNGVAILTGNETVEQLKALAEDIFLYFGLGCRNVSKIYVPEGYDFTLWNEAIADWEELIHHNKYKNNLDYNFTIYIINKISHIQLGHLILKEDDAVASRIGCVNYSFYNNETELLNQLETIRDEIQCLVCVEKLDGWNHVEPGTTQLPSLFDYADGVDTMRFLNSLSN